MVYDITEPEQSSFVNYINSRDFSQDIAGDDSPEGLCFIPAADSADGNAYLLASCEVSGTVAAYRLTEGTAQEPGGQPGEEDPDDTHKPGSGEADKDAGKDAPKTGDQNFAGVCCMSVFAAAAATGMAVMAGRRRSDR